jgi:hypothetical protein
VKGEGGRLREVIARFLGKNAECCKRAPQKAYSWGMKKDVELAGGEIVLRLNWAPPMMEESLNKGW